MGAARAKTRMSLAEYEALLEQSVQKWEYVNGEAYAMAGGTHRHAIISGNVVGELRSRLRAKPCVVSTSDTMVFALETGICTFPDVVVTCGPAEHPIQPKNAVTNPTLVVEVLSPGTEDWDRGGKFEHYKRIACLMEVVIVATDGAYVEVRRRLPTGQWLITGYEGLHASADLESLGIELPLAEVYLKAPDAG